MSLQESPIFEAPVTDSISFRYSQNPVMSGDRRIWRVHAESSPCPCKYCKDLPALCLPRRSLDEGYLHSGESILEFFHLLPQ
jgi:hypothetical protein